MGTILCFTIYATLILPRTSKRSYRRENKVRRDNKICSYLWNKESSGISPLYSWMLNLSQIMLHSEYTSRFYGKKKDFDWAYWIQCVDSARHYCKERGFPIWPFGGSAINAWNTWKPFDSSWVRFNYKPWMYPKQWDIVFWSEKRCENGHVAVANKFCNKDVLRCFDENGTGHGDATTPRFYDYKNVLGWFSKLN